MVPALLLVACVVAAPAAAQPATPPPRLAIAVAAADDATALIAAAGVLPVPVAVRLVVTDPGDPSLDSQLSGLERRALPVWLAVPAPSSAAAIDAWRDAMAKLVARPQSTLRVLEIDVDDQPADVAIYAAEAMAIDARARTPDIHVALGGRALADAARRQQVYTSALAPYVDLAVTNDDRRDEVEAWRQAIDPDARLAIVTSARAANSGPTPTDLLRRAIDDVIRDAGSEVILRAWNLSDLSVDILQGLRRVTPLLSGTLEPLDAAAARPTLTMAERDVTGDVEHRLLFDTATFATYLVYSGSGNAPIDVSLTLPVEGTPAIHDLLTGERLAARGYTRRQATGEVRLQVPLTGRPMLVDFNEDAEAVAIERGGVTAARTLTVAEVIARHQRTQAAQDAVLRSYIASVRMRQQFRPTITDPGYDVVTENRYFVEGSAVEWEELSFAVNGSKWGQDRPPFPLLQPEKVLSLPLQLRFDEGYRYELDGIERVDDVECYVVRFEPMRRDASLYRGTVWIDRRSFARIRVKAVQSGLPAPVISNEETLRYAPAGTVDGRPVMLLAELTARQIVLISGRNILIEKAVAFDGFRLNDAAFDAERDAARRGDRIMYRETDAGLRYYVKQGDQRVVSNSLTTHVKAMAMGVYLDPSYAFPLPIFGINYLNFGAGSGDRTQLALLFGGVLIAGNVQRPKLGRTPFDASVDFFAIAAPSSDRLFRQGGEAAEERVLTWPMSTGLNLGWQATPYQKALLQYQLRFDAYVRDRTTAETFQPPSSTLTNGIGGSWEYRRGGYNVTLNGTWFTRSRWKAWGADGALVDPDESRTYVKYAAGLSRTILVGPFQTVYVTGNWFGGRDLDRFVQYQFGMFEDTRIHGVPSSGVRFRELGMVRGIYSINVFEQYRLDAFLEHAWGRDSQPGTGWQPIPAVGAAVNFRTFWNTILRAEAGHSVLPARYDGLGSTTLQVLLLKPLR